MVEDTMPTWAQKHFPSTQEEAREWEPMTSYHALHMKVLCVARTRVEGAWAAYCGPVMGITHDEEKYDVLANGEKLSERVALVLFPEFEGIPYAL